MTHRWRRLLRLWRLYLLRLQIRIAPTEAQRLFLLTITIGLLCGLAAVAFHLTIEFFEEHLIGRALHVSGRAWIAWTIATPLLGGIACGLLLHYVVPNARGSGIPQVKAAFSTDHPIVPMRDAAGKFFVGALQIGSGSSLGREGPTVQICAGISSWLGRVVGVTAKSQKRLLPVGVAAGIAAAFNAPIAAVTFTIEEVVGKLDQAVLSGVIVAAALAAVIERSVLGESAIFAIPGSYGLTHASSLLMYAVLGLAAAGMSIAFTESLLFLRARFRDRSGLPLWARPAVGGGVTGILAVVALWGLGAEGITGGGYDTLGRALNGELAWRVMLGLSVLKLVATVFSYSSGGAGGIFAPALFIGGTLGGAIGTLNGELLGNVDEPLGAFALVGMGAVFSGVIRAPMTSVLIIIEMTGGYALILPLMIANMTAYVLARRYRAQPIYEALLEQDGVVLEPVGDEASERAAVGPLLDHHQTIVTLAPGMNASDVITRCAEHATKHVYPVVDEARHLVGIVTPEELGILTASPELVHVANTSDLMRLPVSIHSEDDLRTAIETMLANGIRELPVTDSEGRLTGLIDDATIAKAYQRGRRSRPRV